MSLAVEDTEALLNDGMSDGLGQVALPCTRRTDEQGVFVTIDKATGGELEDKSLVDLLVEVPVLVKYFF